MTEEGEDFVAGGESVTAGGGVAIPAGENFIVRATGCKGEVKPLKVGIGIKRVRAAVFKRREGGGEGCCEKEDKGGEDMIPCHGVNGWYKLNEVEQQGT